MKKKHFDIEAHGQIKPKAERFKWIIITIASEPDVDVSNEVFIKRYSEITNSKVFKIFGSTKSIMLSEDLAEMEGKGWLKRMINKNSSRNIKVRKKKYCLSEFGMLLYSEIVNSNN
ncbi:hypothetical protein R6242_21125 [Iodobacter sp. CM08]|uniref:hypothetical protein n=1 Tax=Iodobacter sp. CM08 TaxID=3085902 RepID=UPI0029827A51|nr:hypothetical protein [Iodobacter sp. CM08]MDW5419078.1 hypothetical protein [Iodobacter sp. CM08]